MINEEIRFTIETILQQEGVHSFFISLDDEGEYCPIFVCEFQQPFRLRIATGDGRSFNSFKDLMVYVIQETTKRRSK